jgi:hypothetical protein
LLPFSFESNKVSMKWFWNHSYLKSNAFVIKLGFRKPLFKTKLLKLGLWNWFCFFSLNFLEKIQTKSFRKDFFINQLQTIF